MAIAKFYGVADTTILRSLRLDGVERRDLRESHAQYRALSDADLEAAINAYAEGAKRAELATRFNVAPWTLQRAFKQAGIPFRRNAQRYLVANESAFAILTPDSEYWAGFIAADGHLSRQPGRQGVLRVGLASRDLAHVEALKQFLGAGHPVSHRDYRHPSVHLNVSSERLVADLEAPGIKTEDLDPRLTSSRHFWRGVVDGDGWLSARESPRMGIALVGLPGVLEHFKSFVLRSRIPTNANVRARPPIACFSLGSRASQALACLLYKDADTALARKRVRAESMMSRMTT